MSHTQSEVQHSSLMKVSQIVCLPNWESVVGSVIQATGTVEFEDGLWIGNYLKARNGLQRV